MAKKPAPARDTTTKTIQQAEAVARDGDIHVNVEVGGFTGSVVRRQAMFWTCTAAIFLLFLVIFSPVLLPFVAGMALAYFLDPVADRLERLGLSRLAATIVILLVFLMILVVGLMIIIPVLATQLADFISKLPDYISQLQALLANENSSWLKRYIGIDSSVIQENLSTLLQQGAGFLSTLLQSLWNSGNLSLILRAFSSLRRWLRSTCCSTGIAWLIASIHGFLAGSFIPSAALLATWMQRWRASCAGRVLCVSFSAPITLSA